jgi:hypothetical protein
MIEFFGVEFDLVDAFLIGMSLLVSLTICTFAGIACIIQELEMRKIRQHLRG